MNNNPGIFQRLINFFSNRWQILSTDLADRNSLSTVSAQVDDSSGWSANFGSALTGRPHDYDPSRVLEIYSDALEAWRKNPIAWRIIAIITDYIIGDEFLINSSNQKLNKFVKAFWHHPKNNMDVRLESMSDELARAGDLFVLLFRNPQDGMSYIRFVTKDRIQKIETAPNDWETELVYYETMDASTEARAWLSPSHPDAAESDAIMLHYSINRPVGALLGESDLTTMLPWLLRYSRMLEDRVRLHWAVRAFLWFVTVPSNRVKEKQEQYRTPPEAGSIIVKDESETWEVQTPSLQGSDARHDMQAVRGMIDAGSGFPPHWRGDAGDISLATAQAMQGPTERHLLRRQKQFIWMLEDILYHAYQRAFEIGMARNLGSSNYADLFTVQLPDISRWDNEALARATRDITQGFSTLSSQLAALPHSLAKQALRLTFKFAGEPVSEELIEKILAELKSTTPNQSVPKPKSEQITEQEAPTQAG